MCAGLKLLLGLDHVILANDAFVLLAFFLDSACVLDNDRGGVNAQREILDVVTELELLARIRTLHEGALAVAELADLVVTPELEATVIVFSHAVPAAA